MFSRDVRYLRLVGPSHSGAPCDSAASQTQKATESDRETRYHTYRLILTLLRVNDGCDYDKRW